MGALKRRLRTGWVDRGVRHAAAESVAEHCYRMGVASFLLANGRGGGGGEPTIDWARVMQLSLVHDLAEAITGDIAPSDNVPAATKRALEEQAMHAMLRRGGVGCAPPLVPVATTGLVASAAADTKGTPHTGPLPPWARMVWRRWQEYERRATPEARACKDLDRLEMAIQADEYERITAALAKGEDDGGGGLDLSDFFGSVADGKIQHPRIAAWARELVRQRRVRRARRTKRNGAQAAPLPDTAPGTDTAKAAADSASVCANPEERYNAALTEVARQDFAEHFHALGAESGGTDPHRPSAPQIRSQRLLY